MKLGISLGLTRLSSVNTNLPAPLNTAAQLFLASNYVTSPSPAIKNAVTGASALGANLFRGSRRVFSSSMFWSGGTSTDNYATAPDGTNAASRFQLAASAGAPTNRNTLVPATAFTSLLAGTYTIALHVKSNTGSSQNFALTLGYSQGKNSADLTATTSWQRISFTATHSSNVSGPLCGLINDSTGAALDLQICDFEMFAGASDLGPIIADGNLYFGKQNPTYSGGILNLNGVRGIIQTPYYSPESITTQVLIKVNDSVGSYRAWISNIKSYTTFSGMIDLGVPNMSSISATSFGNRVSPNGASSASGLAWKLFDGKWHVLTSMYDNSIKAQIYYLDDILLGYIDGTTKTFSNLGDFVINDLGTGGLISNFQLLGMANWSRALSKSEVSAAVSYWNGVAASVGASLAGLTSNRIYCAEGDSITGGFSYSYVATVGANASPSVFGSNWASSGSTLGNLNSRATAVDSVIPANKNGRTFILSVFDGANDMTNYGKTITNIVGDGATAVVTLSTSITPLAAGSIVSISGNSEATFNGAFTVLASPAPTATTFAFSSLTATTGTGGTNSTFAQNLANYCAARKASGWKVIVATILPRAVASSVTSFTNVGGVLTINGSGLPTTANLPVTFTVTSGTLPTGLSVNSTYYVVAGGSSTAITVSTTSGGAAVSYTDAGTAVGPKFWSNDTVWNAVRAGVNTAIKSLFPGTYSDAIADFGGDATMGADDSQALYPTKWNGDGLHPSSAGQVIMAPLMTTAVNSL